MQEIANKDEKKIAQIAQIENFIKEKNVTAVEACRQLGIKPHTYYSFKSGNKKNKGGRPRKVVSTFTTLAPPALVDTSHTSLLLAKLGWHTGVLSGLMDRILSDKSLQTYFETRGVTRETFDNVRNNLTTIAKSY